LTKGVRQDELTFGFICGGDQEALFNSREGENDDSFTITELKKHFWVIPLAMVASAIFTYLGDLHTCEHWSPDARRTNFKRWRNFAIHLIKYLVQMCQ